MILVPNRLRLLSGNNFLLILSMLILFSACSKKITAPKPVDIPSPAERDKQKEIVPVKKKTDHSIALLLPFELNSINLKTAGRKDVAKADLAIDFYQGFKLALDSLTAKGHDFNLQVFDTQNQETRVVNLAMASSVRSNDLIIGPVFPEAIKSFADFAELGETLQISPLAASMPSEFNNPGLVTVNNTIDQHGRKIAEFISMNYKPELVNLVLINTQKADDSKFSTFFKSSLTQLSGGKFRITERPTAIAIESYLDLSKNNLVIIASSDRLFLLPTIDKLYKLVNQRYRIELFGHPNWIKAKYLNQEKMQALKSRISTSYYVNYKAQNVKNFIARYRDEYGLEPSEYSFKGFDIGYYFGGLLEKYGKAYADHLDDSIYQGLHNNFKFSKNPKFGYINNELIMLRYNNFELQPVK
ncbi:ABC-type branched-chain amino acid transport system, substrate-binding protein [Daejeonella rubra]|uniref:ABC-type branched-chain amino acid transport system, substrate-binding protein n=1 Tax=Daejeonella rubra TaxID=990371 RepID=A0A1G9PBZ3_9SPHI|nr:ABC transporter substrate-binding protein [Daejeonella rubra]SDL96063.1 ABC-type branched-chain amino acid transport system, substrate-binding protein [Daejeonella rubra]